MRQTKDKYRTLTQYLCIWAVSGVFFVPPSACGSQWHPAWRELYKELHDGADPNWNTFDDVRAWAVRDKDRLEPVVLEILRGERQDKQWGIGMIVGRVIPTERICDLVLNRTEVEQILHETDGGRVKRFSAEASTLVHVIDICAGAGDKRIIPLVIEFLGVESQAYELVEHCAAALREVGGAESMAALRATALRKKDVHIDRLCALAEKAIEARVQGVDVFANARQELRMVTAEFIRAVEERDFAGFVGVQPYGFRRTVDEERFTRDILPHPDTGDIARALKEVAGREEFQIDRDNYRATLTVDDRYRFTYILEVDGWKISGPIRIGP